MYKYIYNVCIYRYMHSVLICWLIYLMLEQLLSFVKILHISDKNDKASWASPFSLMVSWDGSLYVHKYIYIYIYICMYMSRASGYIWVPSLSSMVGPEAFWTVCDVLGMNGYIRMPIWTVWHPQNRSRMATNSSGAQFIGFTHMCKCKCLSYILLRILLCISIVSRVWKRRWTLFGVDLSRNFGASSVLDLFAEWNDVLQISIIICVTVGVQIKWNLPTGP